MKIKIAGKEFVVMNIATQYEYKKEEYFGGEYELKPSTFAKISAELIPNENITVTADGAPPYSGHVERIIVEVIVPAKDVAEFAEGKREISID